MAVKKETALGHMPQMEVCFKNAKLSANPSFR
ncbi:hypothetical protein F441_13897 [Phytophthora nicotianae CJ01A1]|uniref:Uncharacterized protein n=2 Tax=Phytophthora nicotianae TaxID=4792 RepID=W2ILK1_PHYNI|nr:hypothetical protein L915_13609 [Phytophthora nicotianae]ETL34248.1 hypothetical protein L916_13506 [Phytophthora nicotianae]ETP10495.1 hypothetical protein F441_13897 [Phytophthora nicotianae CJ01A1]